MKDIFVLFCIQFWLSNNILLKVEVLWLRANIGLNLLDETFFLLSYRKKIPHKGDKESLDPCG